MKNVENKLSHIFTLKTHIHSAHYVPTYQFFHLNLCSVQRLYEQEYSGCTCRTYGN